MPAPANDNFATAEVISGASGTSGPWQIDEATTEGSEPTGSDLTNGIHQTVWFSWTAPGSGGVTFDTIASVGDDVASQDPDGRLDTTLTAWTGASLGTLVEVESDDDVGPTNWSSTISFSAVGGTAYLIQVGTYDEPYIGTVNLAWSGSFLLNDDFADAIELAGTSGTVVSTSITDATVEGSEPFTSVQGSGPFQTIWYKWTAPQDAEMALAVSPGEQEPVIGVWTGASLAGLSEVESVDDPFSNPTVLHFTAVAGTTYYIQIGTWGSNVGTIWTLHWYIDLLFPALSSPEGVCVAFDDDTLEATPAWYSLDRAGIVTHWSISRGRQSELDKTGTGTASVTLIDKTGLLDPTNTTSQLYGKLDPMKQVAIAIRNPVTDTYSTVFRGFVSEWLHDLEVFEETDGAARGIDTITLEAADAFDLFAALELTPGEHGDTSVRSDFADVYYQGTPSNVPGEPDVFKHVDQRIIQLLADAGWDPTRQIVFSGNVSVQGVVINRRDQLLAALDDAADAEFPGLANRFMSRDSLFIFHGRYARFFPDRPGYGINTWQAGGLAQAQADPNVAPISHPLSFRRSKQDVINAVIALPQGIDDSDAPGQLVKDTPSIEAYGWRSMSFENLLTSAGHDDDGNPTTALEETAKFADYYVGNYKQPKTRVTRIPFRSRGTNNPYAAALWALICGVELGDVVSLQTVHPGGGGFDADFFIEGISYDVGPARADMDDVTLELDVSPKSFFAYNPFGELDLGES